MPVIELTLTRQGEALYHDVMDFAWRLNQDIFKNLSKEEQEELFRLLDKLMASILTY
jgi:DNA-binding MarR family transcriptional regulator